MLQFKLIVESLANAIMPAGVKAVAAGSNPTALSAAAALAAAGRQPSSASPSPFAPNTLTQAQPGPAVFGLAQPPYGLPPPQQQQQAQQQADPRATLQPPFGMAPGAAAAAPQFPESQAAALHSALQSLSANGGSRLAPGGPPAWLQQPAGQGQLAQRSLPMPQPLPQGFPGVQQQYQQQPQYQQPPLQQYQPLPPPPQYQLPQAPAAPQVPWSRPPLPLPLAMVRPGGVQQPGLPPPQGLPPAGTTTLASAAQQLSAALARVQQVQAAHNPQAAEMVGQLQGLLQAHTAQQQQAQQAPQHGQQASQSLPGLQSSAALHSMVASGKVSLEDVSGALALLLKSGSAQQQQQVAALLSNLVNPTARTTGQTQLQAQQQPQQAQQQLAGQQQQQPPAQQPQQAQAQPPAQQLHAPLQLQAQVQQQQSNGLLPMPQQQQPLQQQPQRLQPQGLQPQGAGAAAVRPGPPPLVKLDGNKKIKQYLDAAAAKLAAELKQRREQQPADPGTPSAAAQPATSPGGGGAVRGAGGGTGGSTAVPQALSACGQEQLPESIMAQLAQLPPGLRPGLQAVSARCFRCCATLSCHAVLSLCCAVLSLRCAVLYCAVLYCAGLQATSCSVSCQHPAALPSSCCRRRRCSR